MTRYYLRLFSIFLSISLFAHSQTDYTYQNGTSWDDANNWSPSGTVPNSSSHNVIFGSNDFVETFGSSRTVGDFTTAGDVTFRNFGGSNTLTIEGSISHTSGSILLQTSLGMVLNGTSSITGGLNFSNNSGLKIGSTGSLTFASGSATYSASLSNSGGSFGYEILNQGSLTVNAPDSVALNNYDISNEGTFTVDFSSSSTLSAGTLVQSSGDIFIHSDSTLFSNTVSLTGGNLYGTGILNGSSMTLGNGSDAGVTLSGGTASGEIGTLTLSGNLNTVGGATWLFDLEGSSSHDVIAVGNHINVNNTSLDVDLVGGFIPGVSDTFTVLTSSNTISGTFSNVVDNTVTISGVGSFDVTMASNSVTLSNFSAVPEPSAFATLAGLTVLFGILSRRQPRV